MITTLTMGQDKVCLSSFFDSLSHQSFSTEASTKAWQPPQLVTIVHALWDGSCIWKCLKCLLKHMTYDFDLDDDYSFYIVA